MTPYYEHAGITIYHGDCREVLPTLGKFDLLLTDPPYGIGAARASFADGGIAAKRNYGDGSWDDKPADPDAIKAAISLTKEQIIWGGNYFQLGPARCYFVWDKNNPTANDFADAELAWTSLNRPVKMIRLTWNGFCRQGREQRDHPTQKPLAVMKWAIQQPKETCESILDPFMGSGTTLRAAKDLERKAIGIEIEERYCEMAAKRMEQEVLDFHG